MEEKLKTGTTTIGIVFKDGIVLAADKRVTAGNMIMDGKFEKVFQLNDNIAMTFAGVVSDVQLFSKIIKAEIKLKEIRTSRTITIKEAANMLAGLLYGGIRQPSMFPSIAHFLIGGRDSIGCHLYDVTPDGALKTASEYVSSGSGSIFAYSILDSDYKKGLSKDQAVNLAIKAINAAIQRDNASGNGIDVMLITKKGVEKVLTKELNTNLC
jgi:proteasome beta subunit